MAEPKFKVDDLVTRGRGRVTYRVEQVKNYKFGYCYDLTNVKDQRMRPRIFADVSESNLRPAEEAKS